MKKLYVPICMTLLANLFVVNHAMAWCYNTTINVTNDSGQKMIRVYGYGGEKAWKDKLKLYLSPVDIHSGQPNFGSSTCYQKVEVVYHDPSDFDNKWCSFWYNQDVTGFSQWIEVYNHNMKCYSQDNMSNFIIR